MVSVTRISIWFFIGIALLVNGGLILAAGLYELTNPPQHPVILFNLHASIWWGGLLFLLGILYSYHFAPGRAANKSESGPNAPQGSTHAR
jgi:hypothetical protein